MKWWQTVISACVICKEDFKKNSIRIMRKIMFFTIVAYLDWCLPCYGAPCTPRWSRRRRRFCAPRPRSAACPASPQTACGPLCIAPAKETHIKTHSHTNTMGAERDSKLFIPGEGSRGKNCQLIKMCHARGREKKRLALSSVSPGRTFIWHGPSTNGDRKSFFVMTRARVCRSSHLLDSHCPPASPVLVASSANKRG